MAYNSSLQSICAVLLVFSFLQANAQISTPCTSSMISSFTPCLNYITGSIASGSSPTQDCCYALKSLVSRSIDCTCLIITGNVPTSIPFANRSLAISLPQACNTSVPVQCKASGDPLPAPGPVLFGPSAAPSAPSAHTSKAAPAEAPPPDDALDLSPASPPELSFDPNTDPGSRSVVNPKSNSNLSTVSFPYIVLMFVGLMIFKF